MDIVSKIWVITWFVILFLGSAKSREKYEPLHVTIGGFALAWLIMAWIPAAIWLLL